MTGVQTCALPICEPDCGVRSAIEAGVFTDERLANLKALVAEEQALEAEQEAREKLANRKGARRTT